VLLGLTPYLYLPLRAAQHPMANWGDPDSPGRFFWVVTAKEYRYEMFQYDVPAFFHRLESYVTYLQQELTGLTLLAALVGAVVLAWRRPLVAAALMVVVAIDLVGTSNYQADAAPAYLLLAAYCLCVLAAVGWLTFACVLLWAARRLVPASTALVAVSVLCLAIGATVEQPRASAAHQAVVAMGTTSLRSYAVSALRSLPPRAVLFTGSLTFEGQLLETPMPFWYAQRALHVRPDVTIVAIGLLPFAWYYRQLQALPAFDRRLLPDSSESFDAGVNLPLTQRRMELLIGAARATHPIFSASPEFMVDDLCPIQTMYGPIVRLDCAATAAAS
jgi:hypothetical protein